ncbi:MAG: MmgE/PrpD family protein [Chloroflexi bacterium]|nr:MmgE/PrpD family protein [Chloroflexota bacterium]
MTGPSLIESLAQYIASALERPLPAEVAEKTKHHVLDTIAAMVTGSKLKPGELATRFAASQGGTPEAMVIGSQVVTTAVTAAMANAMLAHSDETDDSHAPSLTHPGCAIVPAALAVAEREDASGEALLRAVALGYDVGCRIGRAMGGIGSRGVSGHATHSIGPMFGAAAAASALAGLDARGVRHALAYTAQQASGITSWARDSEHVEKAFVFGGMGARNGVTSALFVQAGLTGEEDVFSGDFNFLEVFCPERDELAGWVASLGSHFEVLETNIKKFPVGSPIQAAAEALTLIVAEHGIAADEVARVDVLLPPNGARIVDDRSMPDINLQYCMAVILLDGGKLSFDATHTYDRMGDPAVLDMRLRVTLSGSPEFAGMERQRPATVQVTLSDGRVLEQHVPAVRGTADNPMTHEDVEAKATELIASVLGTERARAVVEEVWGLDERTRASALRPLLQDGPG